MRVRYLDTFRTNVTLYICGLVLAWWPNQ